MAKMRLIEENDEARPTLRHNLLSEGYGVLLAVDKVLALDWLTAVRDGE